MAKEIEKIKKFAEKVKKFKEFESLHKWKISDFRDCVCFREKSHYRKGNRKAFGKEFANEFKKIFRGTRL
ncbi:MAG: hypothetical protein QXQ82_00010 [Candidatus Pacearchaeota archaeon]